MSNILEQFPTKEMEVKIDACMPNKWNPNKMSESKFKNLVASIKLRGFQRFITVREVAGMYEIMDGEHRWKACKELGYKTIKVHNLGEIDDIVAKEITLIFNTLHGEHDILEEAKVLKELKDAQIAGQTVLFGEDHKLVDEKIALLDFNPKQYLDADLDQPQKDFFAVIMGTVLKLQSQLQQGENIRGNDDAWMLVQQGLEWCRAMKDVYSKNKQKIEVAAKNAPIEGQGEIL